MRRFAWVCVVVGILIGIIAPFYAARQSDRLVDLWRQDTARRGNLQQVSAAIDMLNRGMVPAWTQVSPWPGVIAGAALAGFGVLVLAIRRPQ